MQKTKQTEPVMGEPVKNSIARERELAILAACGELAEELMLVEPADYIALLHTGNMITLEDLVSSSIEPFFDERALTFACSGGFDLTWSTTPAVALDFEFLHGGIFAFFRIILSRKGVNVELNHISFDQTGQSPEVNTAQLVVALESARVKKPDR